ncbi:MAG: L-lactate dehydrogenase [Candidatus Pacebacteria bacterium]|jgi:L-lactate dehydrogenase|nr:L-lactate dehydrogenase [Candidatus Paceibacterota bacterium]MBT3512101.1 L-lactate dehydrogenase [Candidatus Paceibacterota bacterium]MBT4005220.1 L-lactate dehydrogenase [Candidatus Paceibacterota bacterium]MBT4358364.1 L-lactate dehydrogenase [Candidatus Paceibacterota bacterium]MBT4680780.1 L-lactate dehydrogenase [Candidatus Paceibacterota bacterium]
MPKKYDNNKVSIIGCGRVGMTTAYSILLQGIANEIVLFNRTLERIKGEELDLEHGMAFLESAKITATDDYADLADSDIIIYTAGCAQNPGETRLDLVDKNVAILQKCLPQIINYAPDAILLIIANPVDILTYKAYLMANWPKGRVFGSGTALDTSRFRFHLSEFLKVSPHSIHAYILGEHGDSSFPAISSASVGGQPLTNFTNFSAEKAMSAYQNTRDAAYKIIKSKGSTYYGIASVTARLVDAILRDERAIFPVSIPLHHYYDQNGVALSVPCVIGRGGVEEIIEIKLNWEEKQQLAKSAETLKKYL